MEDEAKLRKELCYMYDLPKYSLEKNKKHVEVFLGRGLLYFLFSCRIMLRSTL